jgi:hypothetical protein
MLTWLLEGLVDRLVCPPAAEPVGSDRDTGCALGASLLIVSRRKTADTTGTAGWPMAP